jgi:hypothetical protein
VISRTASRLRLGATEVLDVALDGLCVVYGSSDDFPESRVVDHTGLLILMYLAQIRLASGAKISSSLRK